MFCAFCGAENPEYAKFCRKCGSQIDLHTAPSPIVSADVQSDVLAGGNMPKCDESQVSQLERSLGVETSHDYEDQYKHLTTDELMRLETEKSSLTPEANYALERELAARGRPQ